MIRSQQGKCLAVAPDGSEGRVLDAPSNGVDYRDALVCHDGASHLVLWGTPRIQDQALTEEALPALLAKLREDADSALAELGGEWALAASLQDQLPLFAIDRLGRVPIYLRQAGGHLFASTDLVALRECAAPAGGNATSPQGVYAYIYHHMVPAPFSVDRDTQKLKVGQRLRDIAAPPAWYWQPRFSEPVSFDRSAAQGALMKGLRSAVNRSLEGPGKKAAFLSGGLDSSTVVGCMAAADSRCEAYSIGFDAEGYDEMPFARATARHFGVKLNEYYVTPEDVLEALPTLAPAFSEPFGNSSALPAYFCARRATQDGVEVMLAGDGGDELFAGNERYTRHGSFDWFTSLPAPLRGAVQTLVSALPGSFPLADKARSFLRQANTPWPRRLFYYSFLEQTPPDQVFTDAFLANVDTQAIQRELQLTWDRTGQASTLNQLLALDWQTTLAVNDLRKVGGACALAGVDVRYPMLDDELLELSLRIPSQEKLRGKELRHFYRQTMEGWLAPETLSKSKQGFGLPFGVWMREYAPLREFAYDTVQAFSHRGLLRTDFVRETLEQHRSSHAAYYGELVWILCTLELWLQAHHPELNLD